MDHVTFVPSADQLSYTFGGAPAVMRVRPSTVLTLWTEDAYGGRITSSDDVASVALDTEDLNPQTGPFWIEGAQPGDTLVVHLLLANGPISTKWFPVSVRRCATRHESRRTPARAEAAACRSW